MTLSLNALYFVFTLLGLGLVAWGLIQRFRGSTPLIGTTDNAIDEDHAESLLCACAGIGLLLTAAAFWYLASA